MEIIYAVAILLALLSGGIIVFMIVTGSNSDRFTSTLSDLWVYVEIPFFVLLGLLIVATVIVLGYIYRLELLADLISLLNDNIDFYNWIFSIANVVVAWNL